MRDCRVTVRFVLSLWALVSVAVGTPASAQVGGTNSGEADDGRVVIDLLAPVIDENEPDPRLAEECARREDAAEVSREIVVCRNTARDNSNSYSGSREAAQNRYAAETAYRDDPATPDFMPRCQSGCIKLGKAPTPALIIDVTALPKAPPGSDADRISRGLAPLGRDNPNAPEPGPAVDQAELGLPEPNPGG